jgi:hypothetical protein
MLVRMRRKPLVDRGLEGEQVTCRSMSRWHVACSSTCSPVMSILASTVWSLIERIILDHVGADVTVGLTVRVVVFAA